MYIKIYTLSIVLFFTNFLPYSYNSACSYSCISKNEEKSPPAITPEKLSKYMLKDLLILKSLLISKTFTLTHEETSSEGLHTSIYTIESQTIEIESDHSKWGVDKVISIKSTNDDSYLSSDEMSKDKMLYFGETRHIELLNAYGFKILSDKTENSSDGSTYMYKGKASENTYIECSFLMDDDWKTYMEFNTSGD